MKKEILLKYLDASNTGKYVCVCVGRNPRPCYAHYLFPGTVFEEEKELFTVAYNPRNGLVIIPLAAVIGDEPILKYYKCSSLYQEKVKEAEAFLVKYKEDWKKAQRALEIIRKNEPMSGSKDGKLDPISHAKMNLAFIQAWTLIRTWKPIYRDFLEEIEALIHFCSGFWGLERDNFAALLHVLETRLIGIKEITDLSYDKQVVSAYSAMLKTLFASRSEMEEIAEQQLEQEQEKIKGNEKTLTETQLRGILIALTLAKRSCATREEIEQIFRDYLADGHELREEYRDNFDVSLKKAKEQEYLTWNKVLKQYQMTIHGKYYAYQIMEMECKSFERHMKGK